MHFSKLARFALENRVDLIVISSRVDRKKDIPDLVDYKEIKEFNDKKKLIKLYLLKELVNSHKNTEE